MLNIICNFQYLLLAFIILFQLSFISFYSFLLKGSVSTSSLIKLRSFFTFLCTIKGKQHNKEI
jgi:hypothetical protein